MLRGVEYMQLNNSEKQKKVESFLTQLKADFENSEIYKSDRFISFIIAGSYADWKRNNKGESSPSWKSIPDINLYLIINGTNEDHLLTAYELAEIYKRLKNEKGINLMIDLHPFYKSFGYVDEQGFNLQLTTRVINLRNINSYPDYCWFGWKSNYIELVPNKKDIFDNVLIEKPKRDDTWIKYMFMALSSYNNAVHMATMSSVFEENANVFDEVYRYLKEVSKDGISLAIPVNESFDYLDLKRWKSSLKDFYKEHYGEMAAGVIEKLESYENDYFNARKNTPIKSILSEFAILNDAVYNKGFLARKNELNDVKNDCFVLPLWY